MIVVEYMENGSLDSFLRVSLAVIREIMYVIVCSWHQEVFFERDQHALLCKYQICVMRPFVFICFTFNIKVALC